LYFDFFAMGADSSFAGFAGTVSVVGVSDLEAEASDEDDGAATCSILSVAGSSAANFSS
jgi:hypothetical protein